MPHEVVHTVKSTLVPDARDIAAGPVARILLPRQIGSGTRFCWADASGIRSDWAEIPICIKDTP